MSDQESPAATVTDETESPEQAIARLKERALRLADYQAEALNLNFSLAEAVRGVEEDLGQIIDLADKCQSAIGGAPSPALAASDTLRRIRELALRIHNKRMQKLVAEAAGIRNLANIAMATASKAEAVATQALIASGTTHEALVELHKRLPGEDRSAVDAGESTPAENHPAPGTDNGVHTPEPEDHEKPVQTVSGPVVSAVNNEESRSENT